MLKVKRPEGESLILYTSDGPITVVVDYVTDRFQVAVGIDAPQSVTVLREELLVEREDA
jgi:sRNA-binding carbon storage regulator CsrA